MLPQFKKSDPEIAKVSPAGPTHATASPLGARPAAAPFRSGAHGAPSVIGQDLLISGNLVSKGEVQIEGEVQGDIHGTHIVIGEKARITGGIIAEECVIRGHVLGTVRGKRVLLQTQSHVEGDIYHQTLAIEQGAFFEGKSRRTDDPIAGVSRLEGRATGEPPTLPTERIEI
jgi:cytoskeletal protein CcmA (bactofilin family)